MSAMKNYLLDQIDELSQKTGYSDDFLMETWGEQMGEMTWEQFRAATLAKEWVEVDPLAGITWMITISPGCGKPVVRCAEVEGPNPFAVTIISKNFTGLPGLIAEASEQLNALRRAAKGAAM